MIYILQVDKTNRLRAFRDYNIAISELHEYLWDRGVDVCDEETEEHDNGNAYSVYAYGELIACLWKVELE